MKFLSSKWEPNFNNKLPKWTLEGIKPEDLFKEITPELVNTFTRINNLFIKKDSTNALAMFHNTREWDRSLNDDYRLTNTTSFDKIDRIETDTISFSEPVKKWSPKLSRKEY